MFGDKTEIKAGSYTPKANTNGPGGIWASKKFETGSDDIRLKVFTSHQGSPDSLASMKWGELFDSSGRIPDHYDVSRTFGRGPSNVTAGPGGATIFIASQTSTTVIDPDQDPGAPAVYFDNGYIFDNLSVRTKIHHSDVKITDPNGRPMQLTSAWQRYIPDATANRSEFFGQKGTFACAGTNADCALALDDDGFIRIATRKTVGNTTQLTAGNASVTLTFTTDPAIANPVVTQREIDIHRPDTTYMTMGYWMDGDGDKFTVNTFATARYWYGDVDANGNPINQRGLTQDKDGNNNIGMVAGTARYSGDAVGIYVMNKGGQNEIDIYNGEFTADADLTADFGRRVNDNKDPFKVSGTITGFDSITRNSDDLSSWRLTLNESAVNQSSGHFSGTTTGGKWQGQFYGNAGRDTAEHGDNYPEAAVGEFSGDFGNHNEVVGVFGVEKD